MKKSIAMFLYFVSAGIVSQAQKKTPPAPPPPKPEIVRCTIVPPPEELNTFYANNPSVSSAYYNGKRHLIIHLKNGKTEEYNLKNEDQLRSFTEKYKGPAPALPPPPPPPAPSKKQLT